MRASSLNQPLPHPWLRSLETEKSQVAQTQSCREQPFSLQGDRNSGRAHGGPPALMPGEKCSPEMVREPAALRSRGSAGLAFGAPRRLHGTARLCPERGFAPGGAKDAQRVGEGTAADVPFAPGEAARRRVGKIRAGRSLDRRAPEWPDKLLVPAAPPFELPPPLH